MISLWIVILTMAIVLAGAYFVYKMNKTDALKVDRRHRHHPKT
ncbi:hypothetical protein [Bdellovibrio sp. BCCA]|nr:hypothetical protein [uncultured Bdellovibrio sp.]